MESEPKDKELSIESRLFALETAVARLSTAIEPEFAVRALAAPIASAVIREASQHKFSAKFFTLLDLGETVIKYSAALAFARAVEAGGGPAQHVFSMFLAPPSLGSLAAGLRKNFDGQIAQDWPVSIIRNTFRRSNGKPTSTARYLLDEFIRLRNADKGHGAYQSEGYYEDLYGRNSVNVQDCITASEHLQIQLVRINDMDSAGDKFAYSATRLMGATPLPIRAALISPVKLKVGATYLWDQKDRFLPLDVFVTYRHCSECGQEHIFFAERITAEEISYHSTSSNHRIDVKRSRE
jgi:hypothetical protein